MNRAIQVNFFIGSRYPVSRKKLRATVERVLQEHRVTKAQIDVSVVGLRKIQQLNESKLGHDGPTDVLSFPHHERHLIDDIPLPPHILPHLGDVVMCFPVAVQNAKRYGKLVDDQLCFYLEHSLLHILGYHHE